MGTAAMFNLDREVLDAEHDEEIPTANVQGDAPTRDCPLTDDPVAKLLHIDCLAFLRG